MKFWAKLIKRFANWIVSNSDLNKPALSVEQTHVSGDRLSIVVSSRIKENSTPLLVVNGLTIQPMTDFYWHYTDDNRTVIAINAEDPTVSYLRAGDSVMVIYEKENK